MSVGLWIYIPVSLNLGPDICECETILGKIFFFFFCLCKHHGQPCYEKSVALVQQFEATYKLLRDKFSNQFTLKINPV